MGRTQAIRLSLRTVAVGFALAATIAVAALPAGAAPASRAAAAGDLRSYIVTMRGVEAGAVPGLAAQLAKAFNGKLGFVYTAALRGFSIRMPASLAQALASTPVVESIEPDGIARTVTTQTSPPSWGLDRIDQRDLPLNSSFTYNATGSGVHAYIIDTGIRPTHSDFGGRASTGFDAIGDGQNGVDCNGHGTHVAGTVGGTAHGVAKEASLVGVRVLDCGGSGSYSQVIAGIDWVTQNAIRPAVANMSLGGSASSALDAAVRNSIVSGVTYAIAAGNGDAWGRAVSACSPSPARVAEAITVSATSNTDQKPSWANIGSCVDIFAPGVSITSAWHTSNTATNTISGTSMASPHVAGASALYLQTNPGASPAAVATALVSDATLNKISNPGSGSPNRLLYTGSILAGVSATPAALSFGNVGTGATSAEQTVTVRNSTQGSVTINSTVLGGTNASEFEISSNACAGAVLAAGGTCAIGARFSPDNGGAKVASISITHTGPASPLLIGLTGAGVAPVPGIGVSPTSIGFGSRVIGSTAPVQNVTVSSTGTAPLVIGALSFTGTHPGDYAVVADGCSGQTVAPGGSCVAGVAFTPAASGSRTATLNIPSDAGARTVALSGTGITPAVSANPTSVAFSDQSVGTNSTTTMITYSFSQSVTFGTATFAGADPSQFTKVSDGCSNMSFWWGGSSCQIGVRFVPSTAGLKSATLSLPHSQTGSPTNVSLSGNALSGGGGGGGAPAVGLSTSSLAFGTVNVGSTSATQAVTVTNTGTANLVLGAVAITGTNAGEFQKPSDTCTGATVTPGNTCQVGARFAPASAGAKVAALSIPSNAPGSPHVVTLTGTGQSTGGGGTPAVSVSPTSINYGMVWRGTTTNASVTVRNTGTGNLVIGTATITGPNSADFLIVANTCNGATVAPNGTCTYTVQFRPLTAGSKSAALSIPSNAPGSPHSVTLTGSAF